MNITIVGAGPRGITALGRLLAWQHRDPVQPLTVTLVDAFPVGGHVWRTDQSHLLIMNTPAQQITVFADASVQMAGPERLTGPDLATWAATDAARTFIQQHDYRHQAAFLNDVAHLGSDDYAPRSLFGVYLQWALANMTANLPAGFQLIQKQATVASAKRTSEGHWLLRTDSEQWPADRLILTTGHYLSAPSPEQQQFADFATTHHAVYVPQQFPGDADFSAVHPGEAVIIRGLGLSFYDYVTLLTSGRGGTFHRGANGLLSYQASGREPKIIAGSRRGFPYYPKGVNQKRYGEQVQPQFLTAERLAQYSPERPLPTAQLRDWLQAEVNYVYYSRLIADRYPESDLAQFQHQFVAAGGSAKVLDQYAFTADDHLNWSQLTHPAEQLPDTASQIRYLDTLITDAKRGTKTGPLTSALETLRDLREVIRLITETDLLTPDDYLNYLLRDYTPLQDFLAVGPPVIRVEQLRALLAAGIVRLLGPGMAVSTTDAAFSVTSQATDSPLKSRVLVEARTPAIDVNVSTDPLIEQLLTTQIARPDRRQLRNGESFATHALSIDPRTDRLLDDTGQPLNTIYAFGIPTEGRHWMTGLSPRPGVNDGNLRAADRIAQQIMTGQHDFQDYLVN